MNFAFFSSLSSTDSWAESQQNHEKWWNSITHLVMQNGFWFKKWHKFQNLGRTIATFIYLLTFTYLFTCLYILCKFKRNKNRCEYLMKRHLYFIDLISNQESIIENMPIKSLEAILWDENFAFFLLVYETSLFTPLVI
jgi:hypothetical protein